MATVLAGKDLEQREREVANALATVRLEGLEPSSEAHAITERYRDGEISFEDMRQMFLEHLGIADGSLPLSEHDGSEEPSQLSRS